MKECRWQLWDLVEACASWSLWQAVSSTTKWQPQRRHESPYSTTPIPSPHLDVPWCILMPRIQSPSFPSTRMEASRQDGTSNCQSLTTYQYTQHGLQKSAEIIFIRFVSWSVWWCLDMFGVVSRGPCHRHCQFWSSLEALCHSRCSPSAGVHRCPPDPDCQICQVQGNFWQGPQMAADGRRWPQLECGDVKQL